MSQNSDKDNTSDSFAPVNDKSIKDVNSANAAFYSGDGLQQSDEVGVKRTGLYYGSQKNVGGPKGLPVTHETPSTVSNRRPSQKPRPAPRNRLAGTKFGGDCVEYEQSPHAGMAQHDAPKLVGSINPGAATPKNEAARERKRVARARLQKTEPLHTSPYGSNYHR